MVKTHHRVEPALFFSYEPWFFTEAERGHMKKEKKYEKKNEDMKKRMARLKQFSLNKRSRSCMKK